MFLDEPTSGLDASSSLSLIQMLKGVCRDTGCVIVLSIHQPRVELWDLFDDVMVLAAGSVCYRASPARALEALTTLMADQAAVHDIRVNNKNPADVLLDGLSDPLQQAIVVRMYTMLPGVQRAQAALDRLLAGADLLAGDDYDANLKRLAAHLRGGRAPSWWATHYGRVLLCHRRAMSSYWSTIFMPLCAAHFFLGWIAGLCFFDADGPATSSVAAFMLCVAPQFLTTMVVVPRLYEQRELFVVDIKDGVLSSFDWVLAFWSWTWTLALIRTTVLIPQSFWLVWFNDDEALDHTAQSLAVGIFVSQLYAGVFLAQIAYFFATCSLVSTATVKASGYYSLAVFLAGTMCTKDQLGHSIGSFWVYLSPSHWAVTACYSQLFRGMSAPCEYSSSLLNCGVMGDQSGDKMLHYFGMLDYDLNVPYGLLLALCVASITLVLGLSRRFDSGVAGASPVHSHDTPRRAGGDEDRAGDAAPAFGYDATPFVDGGLAPPPAPGGGHRKPSQIWSEFVSEQPPSIPILDPVQELLNPVAVRIESESGRTYDGTAPPSGRASAFSAWPARQRKPTLHSLVQPRLAFAHPPIPEATHDRAGTLLRTEQFRPASPTQVPARPLSPLGRSKENPQHDHDFAASIPPQRQKDPHGTAPPQPTPAVRVESESGSTCEATAPRRQLERRASAISTSEV